MSVEYLHYMTETHSSAVALHSHPPQTHCPKLNWPWSVNNCIWPFLTQIHSCQALKCPVNHRIMQWLVKYMSLWNSWILDNVVCAVVQPVIHGIGCIKWAAVRTGNMVTELFPFVSWPADRGLCLHSRLHMSLVSRWSKRLPVIS